MSFAQRWQRAGEDQEEWDPDDGAYAVTIAEARAFEARDGREFTKVVLRVDDGPHAGKRFADFNGLDHEVGARVARRNLSVYGLDVDAVGDFDDLAVMIGEVVGNRAEVTATHSGDFLNVTALVGFPRNGGPPDVPPDTAGLKPAPTSDDDIPF